VKTRAIIVLLFICAGAAQAWDRVPPEEYGRVIIRNHSESAGLAPVVFDHWVHRSRFTCRLCHIDIGFAMNGGATDITATTNRQGYYCGACHNGKRTCGGRKIFSACTEVAPGTDTAACERCHSFGRKTARDRDFFAFAEKLPKAASGNKIDWEEAEAKGFIRPVDFLEGLSMARTSLNAQNDFTVQVKASWIGEVIFSHKKHAVWNGCEVCHPEIFASAKKGSTQYTMFEIADGQYCGVCHDKVAFPIPSCRRCHIKPVTP